LKPPDTLVFFLDRSLGKHVVASALRSNGVAVEIHDDHFPADAPDHTWLKAVGRRGWIVLTKDRRIRYRTIELEAIAAAGVKAFVLTAGDLTGSEQAEAFIQALPRIKSFVRRQSPPFIASVTKAGGVSLVWPTR
jgi:predicted nuclease of predicted toxin-antitoxin system